MWRIAFYFMKYDISKLLGILFGIVISLFLMGQQLAIFNSMMGSMRGLARTNSEFIWVVNEKTQSAMQLQSLDVRIGRELMSIPGVKEVHPVIVAGGNAKLENGSKLSIQLVGIKEPKFIGAAKKYSPDTNLQELMTEGGVIVDKSDLQTMDNIKKGQHFLINDKRVSIVGMSEGMAGFGSGYVITTLERARVLGNMDNHSVSAFLVQTIDESNQQEIIGLINSFIPHVKAWTGEDFGAETIANMMQTSNIAASFGLMVIFCVVAGFAIVGLTLFSSVNDRIRDYGTIKAIGGDNAFIRKLILTQATLYAIFGFLVSISLLLGYKALMAGGKLQVNFPAWLIFFLFIISLSISLAGSLFALRKIVRLEPVQIFRM
jgi:putative ABC transport system permease protein